MTNVELNGALEPGFEEVLTPDALEFVAELEKRFGSGRRDLLQTRAERRERLRSGGTLNFLDETGEVREGDWHVAPAPPRRAAQSAGQDPAVKAGRRTRSLGRTDKRVSDP